MWCIPEMKHEVENNRKTPPFFRLLFFSSFDFDFWKTFETFLPVTRLRCCATFWYSVCPWQPQNRVSYQLTTKFRWMTTSRWKSTHFYRETLSGTTQENVKEANWTPKIWKTFRRVWTDFWRTIPRLSPICHTGKNNWCECKLKPIC